MKRLCPNFQRSKRTVSLGFPTALAGIFLFVASPAVHAGMVQVPQPPAWIPYELEAISLCVSGTSQESSDPQGAVVTLQRARTQSNAAITHGGGANWVVEHNDYVIGQQLMIALRDAAKAPENNNNNAMENQTEKNGGRSNIRVISAAGKHAQTTSTGKLQK